MRAYLEQVRWFLRAEDDSLVSLNLDDRPGAVLSALQVRDAHRLFVDAFRAGRIPGVTSTLRL